MRWFMPSFAVAVVACGGGGEVAPDANEALACMTSGRGETYVAGLEHVGTQGALAFKLVSAAPAPPARDFNTWVLQVSAMSGGAVGDPVTGATIDVRPYMPDHEHGPGAYKPLVDAMPTAGQYKLSRINTWMPGYWEITIDATAGAVHDTTIFKFCIQP